MENVSLNNAKNDIYLYNTGEAQQAYKLFGCHFDGEANMHRFCVYAKNAKAVSVVGDFNGWDEGKNPMHPVAEGIFAAFVAGLKNGDLYKYCITGYHGEKLYKADPYAFHAETGGTASKVWDIGGFEWSDEAFLKKRAETNTFESPMSIYELHLGSWRKKEGYNFPNIRETADELADYVCDMGYTHVEIMPVSEYPFDGSWGYQVTGYYAITSRFGTPQDFKYFVDKLHSRGIGVIADWVPAHFPKDAHGLARFDGTCMFEHENPLRGEHPQWGTLIFNYESPQVVSFLVSNAVFLAEEYHVDGLRIDAVTSMLYLDYARDDGNYVRNAEGGNIDFSAVSFLKKVNSVMRAKYAGFITVAEESTSYPKVTGSVKDGGLGFTYKWNMGFMHDTLKYMSMDHLFRRDNHSTITFSMFYAYSENYILPYSHDEVVHGKASLINKMFGDYWEKFASLRALYGFMFAHPGKKLMFMGCEFAQFIEWAYKKELDWFLLEYDSHRGMREYVKALNHIYTGHESLYKADGGWEGFKWISVDDNQNSVLAFIRYGGEKPLLCAVNFTPVAREEYSLYMPAECEMKLLLSSDDENYYGRGFKAKQSVISIDGENCHECRIDLPPLSCVYYEITEKTGGMTK